MATRGEVHEVTISLPDHTEGGLTESDHNKLVVVLRTREFETESYVPVVLADTDKHGRSRPFRHEVAVDPEEGKLTKATILDCRWVFSLASARFHAGSYRFMLDQAVMDRVSEAIVEGLQVLPP